MNVRKTVFFGTKESFVQAVINSRDEDAFKKIGFVFSVDDLALDESGSDEEAELRAKIKELGGKAGGRSSIATLRKQLETLESDSDNRED